MNQLNNELRDLCTELDRLQARALRRIEEVKMISMGLCCGMK
jgi:hypothetical protein